MRRLLQLGLLLFLAAGPLQGASVIDRVVATVNGHPILQSDWDLAVRSEAFLSHRPLEGLTAADQRATLDRLIDQELIRQQTKGTEAAAIPPAELQKEIQEIRAQMPAAATDAGWRSALQRYGLTASDLADRLAAQWQILSFTEQRLRPSVHIDRDSIESYYRDTLLPELLRQGAEPAPLVEVSPRIEELLSQQRVDNLLTAWLQDLRRQSDIRIETENSASARELDQR